MIQISTPILYVIGLLLGLPVAYAYARVMAYAYFRTRDDYEQRMFKRFMPHGKDGV